jgi:hypothetical protein
MEYFNRLIQNTQSSILDILPYAGGYLLGMLKKVSDPKQITAFELHEGNKNFIQHNFQRLKSPIPNFIINQGDTIGLKGKHFNFITVFYRLEKLPDPVQLLKEIQNIINPSSKILVVSEAMSFFNYLTKHSFWSLKNIHQSNDWNIGPSKLYSKRKLNSLFKKSGYNVIEQKKCRESRWFKYMVKYLLGRESYSLITILEKS